MQTIMVLPSGSGRVTARRPSAALLALAASLCHVAESSPLKWYNRTQRTPYAPYARHAIPMDARATTMRDVTSPPERNWQPWTDYNEKHTRAYNELREAGSFGQSIFAEEYFSDRAVGIVRRHEAQDLGTVRAMRAKWHNVTLIGRVQTWELIQRLALCVDHTDVCLRTTSQWIHCLQVYEGMLLDNVTDERLLLLALVHDVGKLLSLFGEDDANVDGLNTALLEPGVAGGGMGTVTSQWNHDEFGYQKLRPYVAPEVAWSSAGTRASPSSRGGSTMSSRPRSAAGCPCCERSTSTTTSPSRSSASPRSTTSRPERSSRGTCRA